MHFTLLSSEPEQSKILFRRLRYTCSACVQA
jgi:hypothetical protein